MRDTVKVFLIHIIENYGDFLAPYPMSNPSDSIRDLY